ncbi:hypothetical protein D6779_08840 [Candidatus Parcubacteria bacterium]|nr:MAG: hypothetical protein D6779_08840 [Candidatus Parcubacteria bacterium]
MKTSSLAFLALVVMFAGFAFTIGGAISQPMPAPSFQAQATAIPALFEEDFSNSSPEDWGPGFYVEESASTVEFVDSALRLYVPRDDYYRQQVYLGQAFEGDVIVEADATVNSKNIVGLMGLVCRYKMEQDEVSYYSLLVDQEGAAFLIKAERGSVDILGANQSDVSIKDGETVHLKAECAGNQYSLYVNDNQVISITDDGNVWNDGSAGVAVNTFDGGLEVFFDNFRVSSPGAAASSSYNYNPTPRWMTFGLPGWNFEIAGDMWNYEKDNWDKTQACISYTRADGAWLENCFFSPETANFEGGNASMRADGFVDLQPVTDFGKVGEVALLAKHVTDEGTPVAAFIEALDVNGYVLYVTLRIPAAEVASLQSMYEEQAAAALNQVLTENLQKAHFVPQPTPTPIPPAQQPDYERLSEKLITASEASAVYPAVLMNGQPVPDMEHGTWELLEDAIDDGSVCRLLVDRTNADVPWWGLTNCIIDLTTAPGLNSFDAALSQLVQPGDILLTSSHTYPGQFAIYGFEDGHTFVYALLEDDHYVYYAMVESRTISGQTVNDVFTQEMDDFIYDVLSINLNK